MVITMTTGMPRLETIQDQFRYALSRLTDMSYDRISDFLSEIKSIYRIQFYGLEKGTHDSPLQPLAIIMDWDEHEKLLKSNPKIARNNQWENEVNPDIYMAVQDFASHCGKLSLTIEYRITYSLHGKRNEVAVDKKLGLSTSPPSNKINIKGGMSVEHPVWGIEEMKISRPLYDR